MRKSNSKFNTKFISEEGTNLVNRDYFGFVELDRFACYVMADSLDDDRDINSAREVVETIISEFTANPSMSKRAIKMYIDEANQELKTNRRGMRLKASLTLVVTDYMKIRYCAIGNSRFYLLRDDNFITQSKDQSLTSDLVDASQLPKDKAALHEERNNLYAYLGQDAPLMLTVSKKIKLVDGDTFYIFTRGLWEYCDDGELMDASKDAKEPEEILDNVEELILSKQPDYIDNYTLAVTFIDKIYKKPKGWFTWKKALMILIPIVMLAVTLGVVYHIKHKQTLNNQEALKTHLESGEKYLSYNNYNKALEDYQEALKLSKALKISKEEKAVDAYLKLIDQIILGDSQLFNGEYQKAMDTYLAALVLSYQADNAGQEYIEKQLDKTRQYINVFDLLEEGDQKEAYNDLAGARKAYVKAKEAAAALYFNDGKREAIDKIAAIDEAQNKKKQAAAEKAKEKAAAEKEKEEKEKEELDEELKEESKQQELENQERLNEQKNAIEIESRGNQFFREGNYIEALTYYETAKSMYEYLEMDTKVVQLKKKIATVKDLIKQGK